MTTDSPIAAKVIEEDIVGKSSSCRSGYRNTKISVERYPAIMHSRLSRRKETIAVARNHTAFYVNVGEIGNTIRSTITDKAK